MFLWILLLLLLLYYYKLEQIRGLVVWVVILPNSRIKMAEKKLADMTMEEIKIAGTVIGVDLSKNRGDKATLTKAFSDYFLFKNPLNM